MASLVKLAKFSDVERYLVTVTPFGNSSLDESGANIVKFRLPRQDVLFGQDIVFNFDAEADGDAGSDDVFMSNIACVWKSYRVRVSGEEVQHVREVGHLQCIDDNLKWTSSYRTSWGAICQGVPAISSSGSALRYGMRLLTDNFLSNLIPAYKVGQIEVEFELNQSLGEYTAATTAATEVDITNMELQCPYIKSADLKKKYDSEDITIKFTDYDHHRDTSLLSGATTHTTIVPTSHKSLDGVLVVMRNQADVNDPNFASGGGEKYEHANITNALSKLSFVLDGQQIPRREIDCSNNVQLYQALLEYGGHRQGDALSSPSFFDGDYDLATDGIFVVAYPFNSLTGAKSTVSGINTASRTGQLEVHFASMTASVNTQIDIWTRYTRLVSFSKSGGLRVSK